MELNQNLDVLAKANTVVVAAVTDPLEYSKRTAQQYGIKYPIMYDPNHQIGSKYGVYNVPGGMDMGPVDTHSVFLIDKNGTLRWFNIASKNMYVPWNSILKEVQKL